MVTEPISNGRSEWFSIIPQVLVSYLIIGSLSLV
jgi:hypothetical protein